MATAAELLAGVVEVDRTLVIDSAFRTINIPSSVPTLGVEHDDDVLRLNFRMPRYVSNTDLSGFTVRINYINAQGESDVYTVKDVVVGDQYITFTWLVGPTAVRYKGNTKFNVCAKTLKANGTDDDGNTVYIVDREFNTTIATLPVLEGLEVDESIVSEYSDLIEQWKRELFGIGDTEEASIKAVSQNEQAAIEAKGAEVLATIPAEYTETAEAAQEGIRTKADAIVCEAQGEVITVSDSSNDHIRGLKVFGKSIQVATTGTNLFNPYAEQNTSFGTATVENNGARITVTGTYYVSWPLTLKAGVTYYINYTTVGNATNRAIRFEYPDKEITGTVTNPAQFTPTKDTVSVYLYAGQGTEDTIIYENVQISEGNSAIPWEPYSGGVASPSTEWPQEMMSLGDVGTIDVGITGKNLLPYPYETKTTTISGVTITVNVDGTIRLNGTATAGVWFPLKQDFKLPAGNYAVKVLPDNWDDAWGYVIWNGIGGYFNEFRDTFEKTTSCNMSITLYNGVTLNDVVLKPQIEVGSTFTEYEPPKTQTLTISTSNGISGIPVTTGGNYTDENGQQWVCDEVDFERGVHIQRVYALVSDYNSGWKISGNSTTNHNAFYRMNTELPTMIKGTNKPVVCTHFTMTRDPVADHVTCVSGGLSNQEVYFFVPKSEFPDVETWTEYVVEQANAGTPITTYYILNEPIETPLTEEEIGAFKALHTNYPNTTVLNDAGATMELAYNVDTKTYVDNNSGSVSDEDIANAVENYLEENPIEPGDLTDYVKKTDYATNTTAGVIIAGEGTSIGSNGKLNLFKAKDEEIVARSSHYRPIVPANLDYAVKTGLTTNTIALTDDEKAAAKEWLGVSGEGGSSIDDTATSTDKTWSSVKISREIKNNSGPGGTEKRILPMYVDMVAGLWAKKQVAGISNTDFFNVTATADSDTLTVTGGANPSALTTTGWAAALLYDDGTCKQCIVVSNTDSTLTIFPKTEKAITNGKLAPMLSDSQHLTELGYKAYAQIVWNANPKHCDKTEYADRWSPTTYNNPTIPYTKLPGTPDPYPGTRGDYQYWTHCYNAHGISLIPYANYEAEKEYGFYRDINLPAKDGYYEVFIGTVYLPANASTFYKPAGYEMYIEWYLDGEIVKQIIKNTNQLEQFCFDFEASNATAKIKVYYKKMRKETDTMSIGDSTIWINHGSYPDKLIPKYSTVGQLFDSWGEFWNGDDVINEILPGWTRTVTFSQGASGKAFRDLMSADMGFTMRYFNRSRSGATSRWAVRWFYETIAREKPDIMLTEFGINDYHTKDYGSQFVDEVDPYGGTISMATPILADEFAENMAGLFRMAISCGIQPIYIGGSIAQERPWVIEFITRMSNMAW